MYVAGNFLLALATVLDMALTAYMWIVVIAALITWVNPDPYNPIVRFLRSVTEPVLRRVRRFLPHSPIDFSPMIVILAIVFIQMFAIRSLVQFARNLQ